MSDNPALSTAMARSSVVISLLGPNIKDKNIGPSLFADIYRESVFPLMKQHGVKRVVAMGTLSIRQPDDRWTFFQTMLTVVMPLFAGAVYRNMLNLADLFEKKAEDLDWTVFRIAQIPGDSDEASWRRDREGALFTGPVGEKGWSSSVQRAGLARWLVDAAEGKAKAWIGKMPAVSHLVSA